MTVRVGRGATAGGTATVRVGRGAATGAFHRAASPRCRRLLLVCCALLAAAPAGISAQSSDGSTAAAVLTLTAGSRAAGLAGAYVAGTDADALFYNPAAGAWPGAAASLAVQRHLESMSFVNLAAATRVRGLGLGVTVSHLDFGSIVELRPDPAFGGQRGLETGETVDGAEGVARLVAAVPLLGDRLGAGVAVGILFATLAESARTATVFDAGLQYRFSADLLAGVALRHAGSDISGSRLADAPLPTELRIGAAWTAPAALMPGTAVAVLHTDVVMLRDGTRAAAGAELTLPVRAGARATVRAGYSTLAGSDGFGRLSLGAGLAVDRWAVDYTFQSMDVLGVVHRIGLRWSRTADRR